MDIIELIRTAKERGASDLHMSVGSPAVLRIHGRLVPAEEDLPLTASDMREAFDQITTDEEKAEFQKNLELDFGYSVSELTRLRCNAAFQRGTISLALRLIATEIPSIDSLHIPEICKELILKPRGMLVLSGPTGSGKSTTLAAMIDYLNQQENRRVVTIEDPIEYIYTSQKCNIIQRELGGDTHTFVDALRHVLRQDPDVILVGEMRDLETASAALTIAETGHLVLTTGHAPSSYQTVERIIDLFPPHERPMAQTRLASLLIGIMCQTLVPTADEKGRVPAVEIMLANPAVRNLIREGKIHQLPNAIRTHTKMGMQLMDQSLVNLHKSGQIDTERVYAFCNDPEEVEMLIANTGDERMLSARWQV
ncbi:MAG: type IV pilus twitching motility protein PilT [Dehalococcoidales bacterium]|nr:type IV pilus twitching motility protein PilT [Dehalococcoidales bacterium]